MAAKTRVRLSALARADLREIARYTAERWSIDQATHYAGEIRDALVQLGDGSREGRPIEACEGYWKLRVRSHFIVYRRADNGFDVVRVLHQRMDVPGQLQQQGSNKLLGSYQIKLAARMGDYPIGEKPYVRSSTLT